MLITEWNFELEKKISNEEAREDGFAKGEARGIAKGEAKGIAKGEAKGKVAVARNLRALGVDAEVISKASGLSVDEIRQL
jgi:predicted transposase/invertase (TIGR01784 family)